MPSDAQSPPPSPQTPEGNGFARRALMVLGLLTAIVLLTLLAWQAVYILLMAFGGVLLALFLLSMSRPLSHHTRLSETGALATVLILLLGIIAAVVVALTPMVVEQVDDLTERLPEAWNDLIVRMEDFAWGQVLIEQLRQLSQFFGEDGVHAGLLMGMTDAVTAAFSAGVAVIVVLFVGLYGAFDPKLYTQGLIRLVPMHHRPRAHQVVRQVGESLRWWLLGRLFAMFVVGVLTWIGLEILGIPLAPVLGILAGLLDFIPNIGPIAAMLPALLLAMVEGPTAVVWVLILYTVVQQIESFLVTPIVQYRAVHLPPAVTIITQVMLGVLLGIPGLILATPLVVVAIVLIKMLYVEDTLGDWLEEGPEEKSEERKKIEAEQARAREIVRQARGEGGDESRRETGDKRV